MYLTTSMNQLTARFGELSLGDCDSPEIGKVLNRLASCIEKAREHVELHSHLCDALSATSGAIGGTHAEHRRRHMASAHACMVKAIAAAGAIEG